MKDNYTQRLNTLKEEVSYRAKQSHSKTYYTPLSDSALFFEESSRIFNEIIKSQELTFMDIFELLQQKYFFSYIYDDYDVIHPRILCGFDVLINETSFIELFLTFLSKSTGVSKKIPREICKKIYDYLAVNENIDNDINIDINNYFNYLENLPLNDCIKILKINTTVAQTELCKKRVSELLVQLWAKGAEITEIMVIYKLWLSEEDFFKQLTKHITTGPWTRKQCEKILDRYPEFVTYLVDLPESTKKLKIIDACLEKYTTLKNNIFSYTSKSRKKFLACKESILTVDAAPATECVEVFFQSVMGNDVNNTIVAHEVIATDNPYLDYTLLNKARNVLSIFATLQDNNSMPVRIEIPEKIRKHIDKSVIEYRVPSTISHRTYAQRRNKKADFLEQLMEYIQRHQEYSYKQCIEAFKNLRHLDFNDSVRGDSAEAGNVHRVLSMLEALDNDGVVEELARASAPPFHSTTPLFG